MSIRTTKRWAPAIRLWSTVPAVLLASVTVAAWTPAAADAAPSCGIGWGSLDKAAGNLSTAPIVNVRAGQHPCYDRLIVDVAGAGVGSAPATLQLFTPKLAATSSRCVAAPSSGSSS